MSKVLEVSGNGTVDWKVQYWQIIQSLLHTVRQNRTFPPELIIPVSGSGGVFELGGSNESFGIAMVPAVPSGKPGWCLMVPKPAKNGPHALVKIWPDCLIGLGVHKSGSEQIAIYKVVEMSREDTSYFPDQGLGYAKLRFFAEPDGTLASMHEPDPQAKTLPAVKQLLQVVREKLFMFGCTRTIYTELLQLMEREKAEAFFLEHVQNKAPADLEEIQQGNSFQETYDELIETCAAARAHHRLVRVVAYWRPLPGMEHHPDPPQYVDYFVFAKKRHDDPEPFTLFGRIPPMLLTPQGESYAYKRWATDYAHRLLPYNKPDKNTGQRPKNVFYCFNYVGSNH